MAKFTCEVDTEAKIMTFYRDGNEISAQDFSIGCYTHSNEDHRDTDKHCYISYSQKDSSGNVLTTGISFRNGENAYLSESVTTFNFAREVGKLHAKAKAVANLSKSLTKEKTS